MIKKTQKSKIGYCKTCIKIIRNCRHVSGTLAVRAENILIDIKNSDAKSHANANGHSPSKAHDGNYNTFYMVKSTAGNYLKLYLDGLYTISTVKVTNRLDEYTNRFINTKVMVITTDATRFGASGGVTDCGTVTGNHYSVYQTDIWAN